MTIYKIQIDELVREATAEEAAQIKAQEAEAQAQAEAIKNKAAAKKAILLKLGLSDEEAAALLS